MNPQVVDSVLQEINSLIYHTQNRLQELIEKPIDDDTYVVLRDQLIALRSINGNITQVGCCLRTNTSVKGIKFIQLSQ